jgi:hypothetical protein
LVKCIRIPHRHQNSTFRSHSSRIQCADWPWLSAPLYMVACYGTVLLGSRRSTREYAVEIGEYDNVGVHHDDSYQLLVVFFHTCPQTLSDDP